MASEPAETVLILEDEPGVARLQQRRLERAGYQTRWAATAADARADLASGGVDLLVLDYRLPDAPDGLALYRDLKAAGHDLPVILVTGYPDDRTVIEALRAGVRDFVTKSAAYLDYLPEAVGRVLAQEREARERQRAEAALREAHARLEGAMADLQGKTEELRATTQQLWQAAKLASVGELAASIAHELNNPLGTVSLRLETIVARTPGDAPTRPLLAIVEQEVERMARLVRNLLQFCRHGADQVSTVNVCDEVLKSAELVEHYLRRRGVTVVHDFAPPGITVIYGDRQKLRQVFLNLFTNAADAMPGGGTLTARVRPGATADGKPAVEVAVADTGHGIPDHVLPRVMDPFFTTKDEGKGTGLGLAICRRIVQEHSGSLAIESVVGKGTTVRIVLPVQEGANVRELNE
jgi:signal transduction histidine kinase